MQTERRTSLETPGDELGRTERKKKTTHAHGEAGVEAAWLPRAYGAAKREAGACACAEAVDLVCLGSVMAHRPKRTFRQRRTDSSDSDSGQEPTAEPGVPGEQVAPGPAEEGMLSEGGCAEVAERLRRARGGGRGRGRVWASSRRAAKAAPRLDPGSDAPGDTGRRRGCPGRGREEDPEELGWFRI